MQSTAGALNGQTRLREVDCVAANSAVAALKSLLWGILLERIGDTAMLYLLSHTSIFSPLPNRCYLQIAGGPIHMYGPNPQGQTSLAS